MKTTHLFMNWSLPLISALSLGACVPPEVSRDPLTDEPIVLEDGTTITPESDPKDLSEEAGCKEIPNSLKIENKTITANLASNQCAVLRVCISPELWKTLPESSFIPGIDFVILFDVTGSMSPYIRAMIKNMKQLIANFSAMTPSLRLGLASFKDFGDRSGTRSDKPFIFNIGLTSDTSAVSTALGKLTAGGGGDLPESFSTALKAAVDGKAFPPYFGATNMGWDSDPGRIRVVLGISDAADRKSNLPAGAPTFQVAAKLLKEQGILFVGIGRKGPGTLGSYDDFAYVAKETGALVKSPGIDLDGDGVANTSGEVKPGEPAVLQMDSKGNLLGAPLTSDPTKVLANAIAQMVKQVKPFKVNLSVNVGGRKYVPLVNTLAVPPEFKEEICFSDVGLDALAPVDGYSSESCPVEAPVTASASEETSATDVDGSYFKTSLQVGCGSDGKIPTGPERIGSEESDSSTEPEPTDDQLGGVLGV